jgi:hypothetical protein
MSHVRLGTAIDHLRAHTSIKHCKSSAANMTMAWASETISHKLTYCLDLIIRVIIDGVWIGNWMCWTLTTRNYKWGLCCYTVLHTSQIAIKHTRYSQSLTVFTSRCLVADFKGGRSRTYGFPNCSRPQLPPSNSNSSQRLNPSSPLTPTPNLCC